MQAKNNLLTSIDDIMDAKYGKVGTPEREVFRQKAYAYYADQMMHDAWEDEWENEKAPAKNLPDAEG
ncbi:MAG: hypothetical protein LBF67_07995 [Prevotellaceae bacterium]|jgi:hypothetical protein|nr:hypothetical protein [Prevotellaceae bacterium]